MSNYRGYFNSLDCTPFRVDIINDTGSTAFTEVHLSGNQPFVVKYNNLSTIFSPKMISTATISVVNDGYLQEVYSPYAQGTQVILYDILDETDPVVVWCGYLKPQTYSQGYSNEWETIELEASDCLASLQYMDYQNVGSHRQIVTFKDIIDNVCNAAKQLRGYYWPRTKKLGATVLLPEHLKISEQNFYTSDSDEPWKYDEVLEEMCKYLGLTVLQWNDMLYFIDFQSFHSTEDLYVSRYLKSNNYASHTEMHLAGAKTISADTYRGNSNNISFEPIYNKATVKSNFYFVDNFIPDIFEEEYLTNRLGGTKAQEVPLVPNTIYFKESKFTGDTGYTPVYINIDGKQKHDEPDNNYWYYRKMYDNQFYESVYMTTGLTEVTPSAAELSGTGCTRNYVGATVVDFTSVERGDSNSASYEVASSAPFTKYLLIHQYDRPDFIELWPSSQQYKYANDFPAVFKLKAGYYNPIITDGDNTYLALFTNAIFERYKDRDYINPE